MVVEDCKLKFPKHAKIVGVKTIIQSQVRSVYLLNKPSKAATIGAIVNNSEIDIADPGRAGISVEG